MDEEELDVTHEPGVRMLGLRTADGGSLGQDGDGAHSGVF